MEAWMVQNEFRKSAKSDRLFCLFQSAFKRHGIDLLRKTPSEIGLEINADRLPSSKPAFVLFYDKDIPLAKRLERYDIRVFNSSESISLCDDKLAMYEVLKRNGIPFPRTFTLPKTFEGTGYANFSFLDSIEKLISYPFLIKEAFGSYGEQVHLVFGRKEAEERIASLGYKDLLIQEYIHSSKGRDVRVNVVGDKITNAMHRENPSDYRSNISIGGTGKPFDLPKEWAELALKAAKAFQLDFAGVDLLFGPDGDPIVCEVNSNPQIASTLDVTGVNLAEAIADYICSKQQK